MVTLSVHGVLVQMKWLVHPESAHPVRGLCVFNDVESNFNAADVYNFLLRYLHTSTFCHAL